MLWLKAFHIVFVVSWFAGLFYLPRLFVYHVDVSDDLSHQRFLVMERRLLGITHLAGTLALTFGLALLFTLADQSPDYLRQGWLHAKLALVALLIAYHLSLAILVRRFRDRTARHSARWYRVYNELPALLLIGIVILVVVRPF